MNLTRFQARQAAQSCPCVTLTCQELEACRLQTTRGTHRSDDTAERSHFGWIQVTKELSMNGKNSV